MLSQGSSGPSATATPSAQSEALVLLGTPSSVCHTISIVKSCVVIPHSMQ